MKVNVLSPVHHDGKDYAEGDTLELKDDAAAEALIAAGVAEAAAPSKKAAKAAETAEG